jgi:hypothetical protein
MALLGSEVWSMVPNFRLPAIRLPDKVPAGKIENGIVSWARLNSRL